mgnify:CR=1 FL=1
MGVSEAKTAILENRTALGIEFGSTRIKAVLVDGNNAPIASGGHEWENRYENGVWTYSLEDIWSGLQDCYQQMAKDVEEKYGVELTSVGAIGISAMMHGYMPFDKEGNLNFRTECEDGDFFYDEIGSVLKIKQMQREKTELFESLEMYYRVFFLGEEFTEDKED